MNIDPRNLTIKRWCDQMVERVSQFGQAQILANEADWRDWGETICKLPGIAKFNPPTPAQFTNFYSWAEQFNLAVRL